MTLAEARKQISRESRDLDEPYRTALVRVHAALDIARALATAHFGEQATPEHALALLDHLLAQAERAAMDPGASDEDE